MTRLLLTTDAVGGVWTYATDLARALAPLGIHATLAVVGPPPSDRQREAAADLPVIDTGLPLDWLSDAEAAAAAGAGLARLAADHDLVHVNQPALAAADYPVPVVAAVHGCLATWWDATEGSALPAEWTWHRDAAGRGLRAATAAIAPTAAFAETVQRLYALPARPAVVHNGRRPLGGAGNAGRHDHALTAGRLWDRAKNTALLDRVAARLAVPFYAAGAAVGPQGERATLSHLQPLGALDEATLARRLAQRPVFVSAAIFEPFGLAVLEAAQFGCPLVLADTATFRELWDGAAAFVPANDEAGFARAISAIVQDEGMAARMGAEAQARAARYTADAMAAGTAAIYAGVLGRRRAAA